jgi:hypothetical protein
LSLYGFSEHEAEKMFHCKHDCPYPDYEKFYDYYGQLDYGDLWIEAAFEGRSTNFASVKFDRGNVDFSKFSLKARAGKRQMVSISTPQPLPILNSALCVSLSVYSMSEAIQRATVYMNVFIHVYRTMQEFSIERCRSGTPSEPGHWTDPVTQWDSAVAFYVGSLEGAEGGTGQGQLLYTLADETCSAFRTCGEMRTSTAGTSSVNLEILSHFRDGQRHLEQNQCDGAQSKKDRIIQLMTVPLIQGTLQSAYNLETKNNSADTEQEQQAVAAAFAAAILPDVHFCNAADAQTIYEELKVGKEGRTRFLNVKSAFERNYQCLGVTCQDVGGLFDARRGRYFKTTSPCGETSASPTAGWALLGLLSSFVAFGLVLRSRKRVLEFVTGVTPLGVRMPVLNAEENTVELISDSTRYNRVESEEIDSSCFET